MCGHGGPIAQPGACRSHGLPHNMSCFITYYQYVSIIIRSTWYGRPIPILAPIRKSSPVGCDDSAKQFKMSIIYLVPGI